MHPVSYIFNLYSFKLDNNFYSNLFWDSFIKPTIFMWHLHAESTCVARPLRAIVQVLDLAFGVKRSGRRCNSTRRPVVKNIRP